MSEEILPSALDIPENKGNSLANRSSQVFGKSFEGLRARLGSQIQLDNGRDIYWREGRYICHTEDEPGLLSTRHDDIGEAMQQGYDRVALYLNRNGCGDGLVFDTHTDRIVAVFGRVEDTFDDDVIVVGTRPLPHGPREERMKFLVKAWDREAHGADEIIPFIWNTLSA